jgi:hypothetical protein
MLARILQGFLQSVKGNADAVPQTGLRFLPNFSGSFFTKNSMTDARLFY